MNNQNTFKAGVAVKDISPDKPELLKLTWAQKVAKGINTPIKVKALVVTMDEIKCVIITADQIGTGENRASTVREAVADKINCLPENIIFSASHAHLSMGNGIDDSEESQKALKEYNTKITDSFVQVILEADNNLEEAEIAGGQGVLDEPVGSCRRMQLSTGACQTAWGAGAVSLPGVKMVGPATDYSNTIDFACLRRPGQESPFAILTSYGSHIHLYQIPYFCAEMGGAFQSQLETRFPGTVAMYAYSMGGNMDMNEIFPRPDRENEEEIMRWYNDSLMRMGSRFADAVEKVVPGLSYKTPSRISHTFFNEKIDWPEGLEARRPLSKKLVLHALALGNIAIVNMPGELFKEYYHELHLKNPFEHLIITAQNECRLGYIGSPISYEKGGYEIKGAVPLDADNEVELRKHKIKINASNPGTGTAVINKIAEMLEEIKS